MRLLNSTLTITISLFMMTSCNSQTGVIHVGKNKKGGLYEIGENGKEFLFYNGKESFKLDTLTYISFDDFEHIMQTEPRFEGIYSMYFKLNDVGILKFTEMTERNIGKPICFIIDEKVMAAPNVQAVIPNGQGEVTIADKSAMDEMIEYLKN